MILSHLVAASENNVIGSQNALPWDIPEDTAFFKSKTKGHALIMGRKTFESIGRPLPHRLNVVITRQSNYSHEGIHVVSNLEQAIAFCQDKISEYGEEVFIIGGGEIYRQSMKDTDIIYLTRIHKDFEGDVKYPDIDPNLFEEIDSKERTEPIPFTFYTYKKRAK